MTFATTTLAALSIAAVAASRSASNRRVGTDRHRSTAAKPEQMILAQRRASAGGLGYGRTGSFGCG